MKPIEFTLICIVSGIIIWYVYLKIDTWMRKLKYQEGEYNKKYNMIDCCIRKMEVTPANYDYIMRLLVCLGTLPHKNKEKTVVLTNAFWIKFQSERLERLSEDEFSAENSL